MSSDHSEEPSLFRGPAGWRGRRVFTASFLCVKWFFLKKNLSVQNRPGGRRRRLSKEAADPCQPNRLDFFEAFQNRGSSGRKRLRGETCGLPGGRSDDSIEGAEPNRRPLKKQEPIGPFFLWGLGTGSPRRPRRPARFRARRRYTQRPFQAQPDSDRFANFLTDPESASAAAFRAQPAAI